MKEAVIFDIDGVLSDSTHRQHILPDWSAFYKEIPNDPPCNPLVNLACLFYWDMNYNIILLTSRPESARKDTEEWLFKHEVPYEKLIMREEDNHDLNWKVDQVRALREEYTILWIFEDDPKNIALFKKNNFPIIPVLSGYYTKEVNFNG